MNQLEAGPPRASEAVNLSAFCAHWTEEFVPFAQSRGIRLTLRASKPVVVQAALSHLDILLRNLLENAVKYAEPDSEVEVCVATSPAEIVLSLFNRCPFSPIWDEAKLFEPFYRPDASRNSETGGNGLGLAICKAVAGANGWGLSLRQEAAGVRAEVRFGPRHTAPN